MNLLIPFSLLALILYNGVINGAFICGSSSVIVVVSLDTPILQNQASSICSGLPLSQGLTAYFPTMNLASINLAQTILSQSCPAGTIANAAWINQHSIFSTKCFIAPYPAVTTTTTPCTSPLEFVVCAYPTLNALITIFSTVPILTTTSSTSTLTVFSTVTVSFSKATTSTLTFTSFIRSTTTTQVTEDITDTLTSTQTSAKTTAFIQTTFSLTTTSTTTSATSTISTSITTSITLTSTTITTDTTLTCTTLML